MDNSFIEIGNIITQASAEVVEKLRSILDRHGIFNIVDGVGYNQPHTQAARRQHALHQRRVSEINQAQYDSFCKDRELIVPDLYILNFMSLIYLDPEEADFLALLLYEEDRKNLFPQMDKRKEHIMANDHQF